MLSIYKLDRGPIFRLPRATFFNFHPQACPADEQKITVEKYLLKLPSTIKARFTIEQIRESTPGFIISSALIPDNINMDTTEDSVITDLAKWLPNINIIKSDDARVIHLIDKRLTTFTEYAINQTITKVQFSGSPEHFKKYLSSFLPSIMISTQAPTSDTRPIFSDVTTQLNIKVDHSSIRNLLSCHFTSFDLYSNILWISSTSTKYNSTEIEFLGPRKN